MNERLEAALDACHGMFAGVVWPGRQTIDGLELRVTCPAWPEQYDVFEGDAQVAYFRLRHGEFRVDVPTCGGPTIYVASPRGDGMFTQDERQMYLTEAVAAVRQHQRKVTE